MQKSQTSTEEFFLKLFKAVILIVMSLALVVALGAVIFSGYQFFQTPKPIAPAQKAPKNTVNMDEFLKQLKPATPLKEETKSQPPTTKAESVTRLEPVKYTEEVNKIFECLGESNKQSDISQPIAPETISNFRAQFQRLADDVGADRGQPYVTDAALLSCAILRHPQVVDYRKANKEEDILVDAVNYHLRAWSQLTEEARQFEREENQRVKNEENEEEVRVALSKAQALSTLIIAAVAFGLFMVIALYLIFSAIESNLRHISRSVQTIEERQISVLSDTY